MIGSGQHKVFSFVVAVDQGFSPNVDGGVCTLCICKPRVRRTAEPGDWILGFGPKWWGRYYVTYVMEVGRKLTMQEYYDCGEFDHKKPDQSETPDNIYEFDAPPPRQVTDVSVQGHPFRLPPGCHKMLVRRRSDTRIHEDRNQILRDLRGQYALIAKRFWYFGGNKCEMPEEFRKLGLEKHGLIHKNLWLRDAQIQGLIAWLDGFGKGVMGTPRDARH